LALARGTSVLRQVIMKYSAQQVQQAFREQVKTIHCPLCVPILITPLTGLKLGKKDAAT
jgi:hypothetical protein